MKLFTDFISMIVRVNRTVLLLTVAADVSTTCAVVIPRRDSVHLRPSMMPAHEAQRTYENKGDFNAVKQTKKQLHQGYDY